MIEDETHNKSLHIKTGHFTFVYPVITLALQVAQPS